MTSQHRFVWQWFCGASLCLFLALPFRAWTADATATKQPRVIECKGPFRGHLQGVTANPARTAYYWAFTLDLVKTDAQGKILLKIAVPGHHGDLTWHDGKVYVAVNFGAFNQPAGKADSWVYVYAGDDLRFLARHPAREVVHGAGGIACDGRRFIVIGGLPKGVNENYAYEYDLDLHFVKRHVISSGYTILGIQTATYAEHAWWFGCYGRPPILLKTDNAFHLLEKFPVSADYGLVPMGHGIFLAARHIPPKWSAKLVPFRLDPKAGFVKLPAKRP